MVIAGGHPTVPEMGYHARSCHDSSEQISKTKTLHTYCTWQGNKFPSLELLGAQPFTFYTSLVVKIVQELLTPSFGPCTSF